jgi:hypothetical protein
MKRLFYNIKKYFYCKFFHRKHLCYPEVWNRGLRGPWHCCKCHPCGEDLLNMLNSIDVELTKLDNKINKKVK